MAGQFNLHKITKEDFAEAKLASNSLDIESGDALLLDTDGFLYKADAGDKIEGVSLTKKTFPATNQTVEKQKVIYRPASLVNAQYKLKSNDTVFTDALIGSYFLLTTAQLVDLSSASATTGQVRLESLLSNPMYGAFSIANA